MNQKYSVRLAACLMAATLALSMAGCSSTPQPKQPADSTSKSTAQSAQSTPAASSTPAPAPGPSSDIYQKTFGTTVTEFVDVFTEVMANTEHSNPLDGEPTVSTSTTEELGEVTTYSYEISDSVICIIGESSSTPELMYVQLLTSFENLTTEEAKASGVYAAALIALFEPENNRLSDIDAALAIPTASFSEDYFGMATGSIASYMYIVSANSTSILTIDPN